MTQRTPLGSILKWRLIRGAIKTIKLIQMNSLLSLRIALPFFSVTLCQGVLVKNSTDLASAVSEGKADIELAAGTYHLKKCLELKSGTTLKGAGMEKTIITHVPEWKPSTEALPDPETRNDGFNKDAYLLRLANESEGVTISNLTLLGPQVHGAFFARASKKLHLHHLRIKDTLASGIRLQAAEHSRIHDCEFIDAGGRWAKGEPGLKGGITGGGIFAVWIKDSEIFHNRFTRTQEGKENNFYGIKGRQGKRIRIHHNTIEVNFSIEFPFENDEDVEIDHNICAGTISIPKHAGGPVPKSRRTFHIHHNYFRDTYAIEFVRNGVEISHNLFDFKTEKDHGNLISAFGKTPAKGPALFHNNLVSNPGRGVIWMNEPFDHLEVRNNHIIARTTATPRKEGLFGLSEKTDFSTVAIRENIIECRGQPRALFRNDESYQAKVEDNTLINVTDSSHFEKKGPQKKGGLEAPLLFQCGVHGESTVDGWNIRPTAGK
ncbi:right-handed parallel beta-helix repeat-containing protein [Akkermansiaceae bacterium]|nr:right-handed parallel beta-helix repeat-containing protein [Akkermansiaceae bacterium]MDB4418822.1 right-handed parallel beta-helix repeat-containing protein [bacterium]MDB4492161.1 right-handed parallel beta-helix repeat-containing protein [bacterium]MDB4504343.1 right-handed parallel beta-helix repeat-containing protein [Akkermansiaceae bacterium]MDB4525654.1 right-handed parallel beta-helix repeat-containing protein [Akkermansiaceae bacterium]